MSIVYGHAPGAGSTSGLRMICAECGEPASFIEFGMKSGTHIAPCGHHAGVKFVPIDQKEK